MQNIQDYLTTAILAILTTFVVTTALNLCMGLVQLWNNCGQVEIKAAPFLVEKRFLRT